MKNKLYTIVAEIYKELKNLKGNHNSLTDSIKDMTDNVEEVIESRGTFQKLKDRLTHTDEEIKNNEIDVALINNKIENVKDELLAKIPSVDNVVIEDPNKGIAVRLEEVKNITERITTIKPNQRETIFIPGNKNETKSYVRAYGHFLQDFSLENDKSKIEEVNNSTTSIFDETTEFVGGAKLKKKLKTINFNNVYSFENEISKLEVPNMLIAEVFSKEELKAHDFFNGKGIFVYAGSCEVKVDFSKPLELKGIKSNIDWFKNEGQIVVTIKYEDGTESTTTPLFINNLDIEVQGNKRITGIEIEYAIANIMTTKKFSVKNIELSFLEYAENTGNIITKNRFNITDINKDNMALESEIIKSSESDIRYLLTSLNDNEGYTYIPKTLTIENEDFYYADGSKVIDKIKPLHDILIPYEYSMEIEKLDYEIYNGTFKVGDNELIGSVETYPGSISLEDRILLILSCTVNGENIKLPIYNFGESTLSTNQGVINLFVGRVEEGAINIIINSTSIEALEEFNIEVISPFNVEEDRKLWNVVNSELKDGVSNYSNLGPRKEIVGLTSDYKVSSYNISSNGVSKEDSIINGVAALTYSVVNSSQFSNEKLKTIKTDRFNFIDRYKIVKLPLVLVINEGENILEIPKLSKRIINSYTAEHSKFKKLDRKELTMKAFIGKNSILTRINPVEKNGDIKYLISFDSKNYYTYDLDRLKWVNGGRGNTREEILKLNDTSLGMIRNKSENIYIKIKFISDGEVENVKLDFSLGTFNKVLLNEIEYKGMKNDTLKYIDFFKLGKDIRDFKIIANINSLNLTSSVTLKNYRLNNLTIAKWIPIECTDVREYRYDNGNVLYINKHNTELREVKTVITNADSSVASDMNKQNYLEDIEKINANHKDMRERIDTLMGNISNLMASLTPSGNEYVNNFLINNYKEYISGTIEHDNIYVIPNVQHIVGVDVWSIISKKLIYGIKNTYNNLLSEDYIQNKVEFVRDGVEIYKTEDLDDLHIANEKFSVDTTNYALNDHMEIKVLNQNGKTANLLKPISNLFSYYDCNGYDDYYGYRAYYWYEGANVTRVLVPRDSYIDIIFDFKYNRFIKRIDKFQYGGFTYRGESTYSKYCYVAPCKQRTEISWSYDNKEYTLFRSQVGSVYGNKEINARSDDTPGTLEFNKRCRYIRIRLINTDKKNSQHLVFKHIGFTLAYDVFPTSDNSYVYNKVPINARNWETIEKIEYDVTVSQPQEDIRFYISSDRETWIKIKNGNAMTYEAITFENGMTLDDIKALNKESLAMFVGGDIYIAGVLRTANSRKTPTLHEVSLKYTTSDSVENLIKLDPHDFECVYSPTEKELSIRNTSGGDKKFKVVVS